MNDNARNHTGQNEKNAPTHIGWTAGWDSTFRLLQLVLLEKRTVQPHYIVCAETSTGQEIDAMNRIRRQLFRDDPSGRERLLPTKYIDVRAIEIDPRMEAEFEGLRKSRKVNRQYLLLASYCLQVNLTEMEIGIIRDVEGFDLVEEALFRHFLLPLLNQSKMEIRDIAIAEGLERLMDLTVFCRRPKGGRPCGFCGPCHDAVANGLGYRLPFARRIKASIQAPLRKYWRHSYGTMNPRLRGWVSRLLRGRY